MTKNNLNREDYYTREEVFAIFREVGIGRPMIDNAIRDKKLTVIKGKGIIGRSKYYIPKNIIDEQYNLFKSSLTVSEAAKKYNLKVDMIKYKISTGKIPTVPVIFGHNHISKRDMEAFVEELNKKKTLEKLDMDFFSKNREDYYTSREVVELLKEFHVSESSIYLAIRNGKLKAVEGKYIFSNNNKYYVLKNIVDEQYNIYKNSLTISEASNQFNLTEKIIKYKIAIKELVPEPVMFGYNLRVKKQDIENLVKTINNEVTLSDLNLKKFLLNREDYYTKDEIYKIFRKYKIGKRSIDKVIKERQVTVVEGRGILGKAKYYIPKNEIDEQYNLFKNSLTIPEILDRYNISADFIKYRLRTGKVVPAPVIFGENLYIKKHDIEEIIEAFNKKKELELCQTYNEMIDVTFKDLNNSSICDTIGAFIKFTKSRVKKSNSQDSSKKYLIKHHKICLDLLIDNCEKEIFEFNDNEMNYLFKIRLTNCKKGYRKTIALFFKYCKRYYRSNCKFNVEYSVRGIEADKDVKELIYSRETWTKYNLYLTDIDKHIERAMKDDKYANVWLYTLLHLTLFWRSIDISRLSEFDLDLVTSVLKSAENISWYKNNVFDLSLAQNVIDAVYVCNENLKITKTDVKSNMVIAIPYLIPIAIAFIACHKHKKVMGRQKLFRAKNSFQKPIFEWFFEDDELKSFSSIKANRTLSTYSFETANKTEGMAFLAYSLCSSMRMHRVNYNNSSSDSTATYILATNNDGSVNDVCHNLFLRGHFGYLYHMMVELVYGNLDELSMEKVTSLIVKIRNKYSPKEMELVSEFAIKPKTIKGNELDKVLKELLKFSKYELKERLNALFKGELPSKTQYIQCSIYPKCIKPITANNCFGCLYSLPTIYILKDIEGTLMNLFCKFKSTSEDNKFERLKYKKMIEKLIIIITEAKVELAKHDNESFIDTLININEIKRQSKEILLFR